jgi:hypothetical protein
MSRARDRVGLGWRPELAASIYLNLGEIDVIELIADNFFRAPKTELAAMRALGRHAPITLHGVGMGLASAHAVAPKRLDAMARLIEAIAPEDWSEHLAFVRAGGIEIGHLAAPPRTAATIEGALRNVARARAITGAVPQLENIATLIDPPGSVLDEPTWIERIVRAAKAPLLLDLHNLYANARNFGCDPFDLLAAMPLERVSGVHISGGVWINAPGGHKRLLDDHLHAPPDPVYDLLVQLASRTPQPLTVVLERDGAYPRFEIMLAQIRRARAALAAGRARARPMRLAA